MNIVALWIEIIGGPIVWLIYLQVNYILAASACVAGNEQSLAGAMAIALLATIVIALLSWRSWKTAGANVLTEDGTRIARNRFMALSALGMSALSVLLVLASAIPISFLGACD